MLAEVVSIAVQKTDALGGVTGVSLTDETVIDVDRFEAHIPGFAPLGEMIAGR